MVPRLPPLARTPVGNPAVQPAPSRSQPALLPVPPRLTCNTDNTHGTKDSAVCVFVCSIRKVTRICLGIPHAVTLPQTHPLLLPTRQVAIQWCVASLLARQSAIRQCCPPPLHVSWRSNGAFLPGRHSGRRSDRASPSFPSPLSLPTPLPSLTPLRAVSVLPGSANSEVPPPPLGGGVGCTDHPTLPAPTAHRWLCGRAVNPLCRPMRLPAPEDVCSPKDRNYGE